MEEENESEISIEDKQLEKRSGDSQKKEANAKLSSAQRARAERNRQRARALREARLVQHPDKSDLKDVIEHKNSKALDSGGGFLLEAAPAPPLASTAPSAPLVHRCEQPLCLECEQPFPMSYLYDTFDYSVCDNCRDDDDAHALITRTDAKSNFLLKDCDLDARPPPLRCVRRPNPHRARAHDMRLYLRAQVEQRAIEVWGSPAALELEHERRRERSARAADTAARRRLRALRMDVRSSLYDRTRVVHEHDYGPESYDAATDEYSRVCSCGHRETYEKL